MSIAAERLHSVNSKPVNSDGRFILYWMVAARRPRFNFALQHAVERAQQLKKPLVVLEPLRLRYRWASDRFHRFLIEGMRANAAAFEGRAVTYYPFVESDVESKSGDDSLLAAFAETACEVISDDAPYFFYPAMVRAVAKRLPVRLSLVDSNTVIPMRLAERTFTVAHSYRRHMHRNVIQWLDQMPQADPLEGVSLPKLRQLPPSVTEHWERTDLKRLLSPGGLHDLPIDHSVAVVETLEGGAVSAQRRWTGFLEQGLGRYDQDRNQPDCDGSSQMSPFLHFGHISAHQLVRDVLASESWRPEKLGDAIGKNQGFWGTSLAVEGFLDQVLTWRELGFNMAVRHPDRFDNLRSLPDWAKKSIQETARDRRPYLYGLSELEEAGTHDPVWNAAQRQLRQTGRMHNYLRMLWGKLIYQWTESAEQSFEFMEHLNNKYALDGRDPNSYSGILWVLGRYDRAWGPKRPVFGSLRYMTSDSARRKLKLERYLRRFEG